MGGGQYLSKYPKQRILKTLINFDLAVLLFAIQNLIIKAKFSKKEYIFSIVGLTSIGNSNWYIFAILVMYISSYVAKLLFQNDYKYQSVLITVVAMIYIVLMHINNMPSWYYNTILCYPFGTLIALYKKELISFIKRHKIAVLVISCLFVAITHKLQSSILVVNIRASFFVLAIIWFDIFFKIDNKLISFFGRHTFSIYILQRISMRYFEYYGLFLDKPISFIILNLFITLGFALIFDKVALRIDKWLV